MKVMTMSRFDQALDSFAQNEIQNAKRATARERTKIDALRQNDVSLLNSLSGFSKTLAKTAEQKTEEQRRKDVARGAALAHEEHMHKLETEGTDDIPLEEKQAFEDNKTQLKEAKQKEQEAKQDIIKNGGSFHDAEKIDNLSGWALYSYSSQRAALLGGEYKNWLEGVFVESDIEIQMGEDKFFPHEARTLEQKKFALRQLRIKYMEENGLTDLNRNLLAEKGGFYEQATTTNQAVFQNFSRQDRIEKSQEKIENAKIEFKKDKDYNKLVSNLIGLADQNGIVDTTMRTAKNKALEIIKAEIDVGKFDSEDLEDLGDTEIDGVKFKKKFENDYEGLIQNIAAAEQKQDQHDDRVLNNEMDEAGDKALKEFLNLPREEQSTIRLQTIYRQIRTANGGRLMGQTHRALETVLESMTVDKVDYSNQELEVKQKIKNLTLTTEELAKYDPRLQSQYSNTAAVIDKIQPNYAASKELITTFLNDQLKGTGLEKEDSWPIYRKQIIDEYKNIINFNIKNNVKDPEKEATSYILNKYKDGKLNSIYLSNNSSFPIAAGYSKQNAEASSQIVNNRRKIENAKLLNQLSDVNYGDMFSANKVEGVISKEALLEQTRYLIESDQLEEGKGVGNRFPGIVYKLHEIYPNKSKKQILNDLLGHYKLGSLKNTKFEDEIEKDKNLVKQLNNLYSESDTQRFLGKANKNPEFSKTYTDNKEKNIFLNCLAKHPELFKFGDNWELTPEASQSINKILYSHTGDSMFLPGTMRSELF